MCEKAMLREKSEHIFRDSVCHFFAVPCGGGACRGWPLCIVSPDRAHAVCAVLGCNDTASVNCHTGTDGNSALAICNPLKHTPLLASRALVCRTHPRPYAAASIAPARRSAAGSFPLKSPNPPPLPPHRTERGTFTIPQSFPFFPP